MPLGQILQINQRLDKLAAARADFESRGMLSGNIVLGALAQRGEELDDDDAEPHSRQDAFGDADADDGPRVMSSVELAVKPGSFSCLSL